MKFRRSKLAWPLAGVLLLGAFSQALPAAEVVGRVVNGTTGQPVPGQFVNLLALREQMVPVRETYTDDEGRYRFVVAANPSERFLVQVPFQGVNYNQPAMFTRGERITADVQVFESGARPEDISVENHTVFIEPHRGHVRLSEFYSVHNRSRPPRTFTAEEGSFRFRLPGGVGDLQVAAGRAGGVSLRQQPQAAGRQNTYVIGFPFKPGDSEVRVSYVLPLSGSSLELRLPLLVPSTRRHVAVPRTGVDLEGPGLNELAQTQAPRVRVYTVDDPGRKELPLRLTVDLAALEVAPAESPPAPTPASESTVSIVPQRVNQAQWHIMGLSLVMLGLGLYYLYSLRPAPSGTDASTQQPAGRSDD